MNPLFAEDRFLALLDRSQDRRRMEARGVRTQMAVSTRPDARWPFDLFTLTNAGGVNPSQIFNIASDNLGAIVGEVMCRQNGGLGLGPVISTAAYPMAFGSLRVDACPRGCVVELTVA